MKPEGRDDVLTMSSHTHLASLFSSMDMSQGIGSVAGEHAGAGAGELQRLRRAHRALAARADEAQHNYEEALKTKDRAIEQLRQALHAKELAVEQLMGGTMMPAAADAYTHEDGEEPGAGAVVVVRQNGVDHSTGDLHPLDTDNAVSGVATNADISNHDRRRARDQKRTTKDRTARIEGSRTRTHAKASAAPDTSATVEQEAERRLQLVIEQHQQKEVAYAQRLERYRRACKVYKSRASACVGEMKELKDELGSCRREMRTLEARIEEMRTEKLTGAPRTQEPEARSRRDSFPNCDSETTASMTESESTEHKTELHDARMALAAALDASRRVLEEKAGETSRQGDDGVIEMKKKKKKKSKETGRVSTSGDIETKRVSRGANDVGQARTRRVHESAEAAVVVVPANVAHGDTKDAVAIGSAHDAAEGDVAPTEDLAADLARAISEMGIALRETRERADEEAMLRCLAADTAERSSRLLNELGARVSELENVILYQKLRNDELEAAKIATMDVSAFRTNNNNTNNNNTNNNNNSVRSSGVGSRHRAQEDDDADYGKAYRHDDTLFAHDKLASIRAAYDELYGIPTSGRASHRP